MTDLVDRLQYAAGDDQNLGRCWLLMVEAAKEIDRLRAKDGEK